MEGAPRMSTDGILSIHIHPLPALPAANAPQGVLIMIIDSTLVLHEGSLTATQTSAAVPLTSLKIPGKATCIPLSIRITESFAGVTSVVCTLQQGDSADGSFTDVAALTLPASQLVRGCVTGWNALPRAVTQNWLRLKFTVSGSPTAGKVFAAILRDDDEPGDAAQLSR